MNETPAQEAPLKVDDIIQYLSTLAKLHSNLRTGNRNLSEGLSQLVAVLKPYSSIPIAQLSKFPTSENRPVVNPRKRKSEPKANLPQNLGSLDYKEIHSILDNADFTKKQLAQLGYERFGISKSRLIRQNKSELVESIRAALQHERSLDTIYREAAQGGESRMS